MAGPWSLVLMVAALVSNGSVSRPKPPAEPVVPANWTKVLVADKVMVSVPPDFDRELVPLGAKAAMLTMTDGTDAVIVTVYSDGAPDALRVHREELQKALGTGPATAATRRFLGKKRAAERLQTLRTGVEVEAEVVAADLGARTVVATFVRVVGGPNVEVIDRIVAAVALQ